MDTTNTSTDGGTSTDGTATDTDTTTGPMPCGGPEDCPDATAPYCSDEGVCVACDAAPTPEDADQACAAANAEAPVCNEGTCVQCNDVSADACTGTTPICDVAALACVGCTQHDQCPGPDSACHIPSAIEDADSPDDGACFATDSVVHIDGDGGMDFTTITAAVAEVADDAEAVLILHDWSGNYDEDVIIGDGKRIAILAAEGDTPSWVQTSNNLGTNPNLRVEDAATVFLHRMLINGNNDEDGPAVEVSSARLHAQRSRFVENDGGGLGATSNAVVELENCFVAGVTTVAPALVATASDVDVRYSTLGRTVSLSGEPVLVCSGGGVVLHDSLVVNETNPPSMELDCPASLDNTEVRSIATPGTWFVGFSSGNYDLTATGQAEFADAAEWNDGDPPTDIDGDPRPDVNGTPDVAGADLP